MKRSINIVICGAFAFILLIACRPGARQEKDKTADVPMPHDTITACGAKFIAQKDSAGDISRITGVNNTFDLIKKDYYFKIELQDFNQDGCIDIMCPLFTRGGADFDVFLFDKTSRIFRQVEHVDSDPKFLNDIGLFTAYAGAGCSDNQWESQLCKLENFQWIRLGEIYATLCGRSDDKITVYKYTDSGETKKYKTYPPPTSPT